MMNSLRRRSRRSRMTVSTIRLLMAYQLAASPHLFHRLTTYRSVLEQPLSDQCPDDRLGLHGRNGVSSFSPCRHLSASDVYHLSDRYGVLCPVIVLLGLGSWGHECLC